MIQSGVVLKLLDQSGVVFEETDHVGGVIKEKNVCKDVLEQY
jgi:hypothetical protein